MWAIALHGGAGVIAKHTPNAPEYLAALKEALTLGIEVLKNGGTSLDAVEVVTRYLEDCPLFNAGKGSVLTNDGVYELEASIMDGKKKGCGAVTGLKTVKNPISLARLAMEKTRHIFLSGAGAEKFADLMGVDRVTQDYFYTEKRYNQWLQARKEDDIRLDHSDDKAADKASDAASNPEPVPKEKPKGTVGCVALDVHGDLAAATSTGGLTNKKFGRIGDSPLIGCGTYANNTTCAVSGTGTGEQFIRHMVSHTVSTLMEYKGLSLEDAANQLVFHTLEPDDGGLIAVDKDGNIATPFNSLGMFRGFANAKGVYDVKIWE